MAALTFIQVLKAEVARMQVAHPEREGELARAHALILHGMVLPSDDDPTTGTVLSSDGEKRYTVNGSCDCQAGQYGKGCKHMQAWKLYQYIANKLARQVAALAHVEADITTPAQEATDVLQPSTLPEAPASANCHIMIEGRQVQLTLRGTSEDDVLARLEKVLKRYPAPTPPPKGQAASQGQGKDWCAIHQTTMKQTTKDGRSWYSHRVDGRWCKGK